FMECGYTTFDWTSSASSSPPTTRSLPQKIRKKMTCRTRASISKEPPPSAANEMSPDCFVVISSISPKMYAKSIIKTINLLGLPEGYEVVTPSEYHRANNTPPGCLTVYVAQCVFGLRFPFHPFLVELLTALGISPSQSNPNSYRLVVGFLLCCQFYHIEHTLENFMGVFFPRLTPGECFFHFSRRPSLAFIHDKPSSYGAWKSRFFFIRKTEWEVSLAWRSSLNELPSINLELVKERVKVAGFLDHGFKAKTLVEEDLLIVAGLHPIPQIPVLALKAVTFTSVKSLPSNPLSSLSMRSASATPLDVQSSERGRSPSRTSPRVRPDSEEAPPADTTQAIPPSSFPLPVMTSQFNPKAGVSNMCNAVHMGDVESLAGRGGFRPSAVIPDCYGRLLKNQLADEESKHREENYVLNAQVEEKDSKLVMQAIEMASLRTTSFQSYTRGREEGLVAGQSTVVAAYKASPEFAEELFRQGSSFYAYGFTVCAE
ncbi:hypothetical protein Salat_2056400, partial [Sesamum alatum]